MAVIDPEAARLAAELRAVNERLAETELVNRRLRGRLRTARANEERLQAQLRLMRHSLSWRITYPVRAFMRVVKRRRF